MFSSTSITRGRTNKGWTCRLARSCNRFGRTVSCSIATGSESRRAMRSELRLAMLTILAASGALAGPARAADIGGAGPLRRLAAAGRPHARGRSGGRHAAGRQDRRPGEACGSDPTPKIPSCGNSRRRRSLYRDTDRPEVPGGSGIDLSRQWSGPDAGGSSPPSRPAASPGQVEQLIARSRDSVDFFELVDDMIDEVARQLGREDPNRSRRSPFDWCACRPTFVPSSRARWRRASWRGS